MTPPGAVVSSEMVDRLIADQNLFLHEKLKHDAIVDFLNRVKAWKENSILRTAMKLPLDPEPTPPEGYVLPVEPPPTVKAPDFTPIVQPRTRFGTYPAPGDVNPADTVINNPYRVGKLLIKVVEQWAMGTSHFWIDKD